MLYTGLNYHRSFSYITTVNDKGEIIAQKKLPSNGGIVEFLKELGDRMKVAIAAIPSWYWLYELLKDEGFNVKLSHPLKTKAIAYARVKTDKVDSVTLAHLLRSDFLSLFIGFESRLIGPQPALLSPPGFTPTSRTCRRRGALPFRD